MLSGVGIKFFVIGATARDVILQACANTSAKRKTRDLDIAIAVNGWDKYDEIKQILTSNGFEKDDYYAQRFYFDGYEVDVVPFGAISGIDDNIYWPPDETVAMSVRGFDEVLSNAISVNIDEEFIVNIAPLYGLFLLKLNAWLDRNLTTNKDAEDMWYIIDNYYLANEYAGKHPEVYDLADFDFDIAGAYLLAHDIADLLDKNQVSYYRDVIDREVSLAEESRLIVQMLDTNRTLSSAEIIKALHAIVDVFDKRLSS